MSNAFDQFDDKKSDPKSNAFDRFDPPKKERVSQARGLLKGLKHVLDRTTTVARATNPLEYIPGVGGPGSSQDPTVQQASAKVDRMIEGDETVRPGKIGEFAGQVLGTVPTFVFGPLAGGAMSGGLMSDAKDLKGTATDMALGAAAGKLGDVALRGAAKGVERLKDPAVKMLRDAKVRMTPGQQYGGAALAREDKMTSLPVVGKKILEDRAQSLQDFSRGAVDKVLEPLRVALPKDIPTGHEAIAFAQDAISQAYEAVLPKLTVSADPRFAVAVRDAAKGLNVLQEPERKQALAIINNALAPGRSGSLTGKTFQRADQLLGQAQQRFAVSQNPDHKAMADVLSAVKEGLRDAAERQNPTVGKDLAAARAAYARLVRVENAASKTADGSFSTTQLQQAVRQGDGSIRKRMVARGQALLQDYAKAGAQVLPRTVPDSGTAARLLASNPAAILAGLGGLAGYRTSQTVTKLLAKNPALAAALLKGGAKFSGLLGAAPAQARKQ